MAATDRYNFVQYFLITKWYDNDQALYWNYHLRMVNKSILRNFTCAFVRHNSNIKMLQKGSTTRIKQTKIADFFKK